MSKRWKAIQLDYTDLLSFENETDLTICLTQRQVAILKALLIPAYWLTRWTNISIDLDTLKANMAEIDFRLSDDGCGVDMDFRDNPSDVCEVQYSKDGGETWLTMFRKDVCHPASTTDEITNIYTDIENIETNNTIWDNDIINVAPDWAYVDEYSDRALCWAINFYVDMVCDIAISQIQSGNEDRRDSNDWVDDVGAILAGGVIATIAALATTPITIPVIAISAVTWATTKIVNDVWDSLITETWEAFENEDAKQVIKCAMFQAQSGVTPQYPAWRDSLEYFTSYGGDEQTIARVVNDFNQNVDIYINYMLMMEQLNDIKDTLPVCPCPERWEHFWDFANVGMEEWRVYGDHGVYVEGTGVVSELRVIGDETSNIIEYLMLGSEVSELIPRCDGFEFHRIGVRGAWDSNVDSYVQEMKPPDPDPPLLYSQNSGWFITGTYSWRNNFALNDYWHARINYMRSCWTATENYGSLIITGITLHGVGVDPFSGRDTG